MSGATVNWTKNSVRLCLHSMVRFALRLRAHRYISHRELPALVIAPHPDDAVLGCGGLIAYGRLQGRALHELVITNGSASHPGHPIASPALLADMRRAEEREAMRRLGMNETCLDFLDATDGSLDRCSPAEAAATEERILSVVLRVQPAEILLPCRFDGSSEHTASFGLVARALLRTTLRPRILEFPIWSWWNPRRILRPLSTARRIWRMPVAEVLDAKRCALRAYVSQVEPTPPWIQPVLSREFVSLFSKPVEYYFEMERFSP